MIHIYVPSGAPSKVKTIRDAIPNGTRTGRVTVHECAKRDDVPTRAEFVVHTGAAAPKNYDDWFAARLGCMLACLPDAAEWFRDKLDGLDGDVRIVHTALRRVVC